MRYPRETLKESDDDGTMPENVETLAAAVVGRRILFVDRDDDRIIITLDDGRKVEVVNTWDCCAYTTLESFLLNAENIDHIIAGVGTTDEYTTWHIFADFGDVMKMKVDWSGGNLGYYCYGFDIKVQEGHGFAYCPEHDTYGCTEHPLELNP